MSNDIEKSAVPTARPSQSLINKSAHAPSQAMSNLWSSMTNIDKIFLVIICVISVAGIILIITINIKLRTIGQGTTCNQTYNWSSTGSSIISPALDGPQGVFIYNGMLYITDVDATPPGIYQASLTGGIATVVASSSDLSSPGSPYIDRSTNYYVPDYDKGCVYKLTAPSMTNVPSAAGICSQPGSDLNLLDGPTSLSFDSTETYMYIADANNNRIMRYPSSASGGDYGVIVADGTDGTLNLPYGVYYDSTNGYLYIASAQTSVILKWKPFATSGTVVAGVLGTSGSSATLLYQPGGVFFDNTNNQLYVNDMGNSRIMVYCQNSLTGSKIAGSTSAGSSATQLNFPYAMAFDSSWNLYVADGTNNRVQKFLRL